MKDKKNNEIDRDRRRFLVKAGRISVLVLLGVFLGGLLFRRKIALPGQDSCINNSICARCRNKSRCILPQAQSYRAVTGAGEKI